MKVWHVLAGMAGLFTAGLAVWDGIGYVAWHFIHKLW
jgi:hypothetical protein